MLILALDISRIPLAPENGKAVFYGPSEERMNITLC